MRAKTLLLILAAALPLASAHADDPLHCDERTLCGQTGQRCSESTDLPLCSRADESCDQQNWLVNRSNITLEPIDYNDAQCTLRGAKLTVSFAISGCDTTFAVPYDPGVKNKKNSKVKVKLVKWARKDTFPRTDSGDCTLPTNPDEDLGCAPQSRLRGTVVTTWEMIPKDSFPKAVMHFESEDGELIKFDGEYVYSLEAELYQSNLLTGRARKILKECENCLPPTGLDDLIGLATNDTSKGGNIVGADSPQCGDTQGPRDAIVKGTFQGSPGCYYLVCVDVQAGVTGHDVGPALDYVKLGNQTVITGHYGKQDCNNVTENIKAPVNLQGVPAEDGSANLTVNLEFSAGECEHHKNSSAKITGIEFIRASRQPIPIDPASCPCSVAEECGTDEKRDPYNGCACAPCEPLPWGHHYREDTPDIACDGEPCPNECQPGYKYSTDPKTPCKCVPCQDGNCGEGYRKNPDNNDQTDPCCILCPNGGHRKDGACIDGTQPNLKTENNTCDCACPDSEMMKNGSCINGTVPDTSTPDNICDCKCPNSKDMKDGQCLNGKEPNIETMNNLCDCSCPAGSDMGKTGACPAPLIPNDKTPDNACDCACPAGSDMETGSCPEGMVPNENTPNPCDCMCPADSALGDGSCPEGQSPNTQTANQCDCKCPANSDMASGSCAEGLVPNSDTPNTCDCKCPQECPPGQELNPNTPNPCDCRCPEGSGMGPDGACPDGQVPNGETLDSCDCKCEECPAGQVLNGDTPDPCDCKCDKGCENGEVLNGDTQDPCDCKCPDCPAGIPRNPVEGNACACSCNACPEGQSRNPQPGNPCACKPDGCKPPAGGCGQFGWKGEPECACGTCEKTCAPGQTLNAETCTCEACEPPEGGCEFGMNENCDCNQCQPGAPGCPNPGCPDAHPAPCTVPSVQNGCVVYVPMQAPPGGCPAPTVWTGCGCGPGGGPGGPGGPGGCTAPLGGCQRGQFNFDTCQCECNLDCDRPASVNAACTACECPPDRDGDNNNDGGCNDPKVRAPAPSCKCECPGNEAPDFAARKACEAQPGHVWDNQKCACECRQGDANCAEGQTRNPDTCQCECPAGSAMGANGGGCPVGQVPNGDTDDVCDCKACKKEDCDVEGEVWDDASCGCVCPPGQICPPEPTPTPEEDPTPNPEGTPSEIAPAPEESQSAQDFAVVNGFSAVGTPLSFSKQGMAEGDAPRGGTLVEITFGNSLVSKVKNLFANVFQGDRKSFLMPPLPANAGTPVIYRRIDKKTWTPAQGQSFSGNILSVTLKSYGVYQVFTPIGNLPFEFGEVYVFPNPTKKGQSPTLHVEIGQATKVTARIYDAAGDLVYEARVDENPVAVSGKAAYEHTMDAKKFTSGVYNGVVTAEKTGKDTLRKKFRFSVVK